VTVNTYSDTNQPYTIYGLDGAQKGKMWSQNYTSSDGFLSVGDRLVFNDDENHQLHFLDPHSGGERAKSLNNPATTSSQDSPVYLVVKDEDLRGPATFDGNPPADSDSRIVQIGADSSVRVVDAASGQQVARAANVDQYGNKYLAYNERLY